MEEALKTLEKNIIFLAERIVNRVRSSFFCFPMKMNYTLSKTESNCLFVVIFDFSPGPMNSKKDYRRDVAIKSFFTIPCYETAKKVLKTAREIGTDKYFEYALRKVIKLIKIDIKE